jgi:hypothetical protein
MTALASIGSVYQEGIVDAGKQPAFFFLLAFLISFGFIRTSAHMIRAQVSWWPGNVTVGGTHIHHMVWGILTLMISGWVGIAVDPASPGREIVAVAFGIGTGLTLDEFALWLDLKDVYWSQEGRKSIDAVIVAAILAGLGVLGFTVLADLAEDLKSAVLAGIGAVGLLNLIFVCVNFAKEKFGVGAVGLFVPFVSLVGAARLGRPTSIWARLYDDGKKQRATERFAGQSSPHLPGRGGKPPAVR